MNRRMGVLVRILAPAIVVLGVLAVYRIVWQRGPEPLVVYCAHDSVYSDEVLRDFGRRTGIAVAARYDTEATKSLGLIELLRSEKDAPRCDVFWNNELLGTVALGQEGIFEPYKGSGWERIPAAFKDRDGYWTGFSARLRVWIINKEKMPLTEDALESALSGDLSQVAIAKPIYGTTLTHYTVLWDRWGAEKLKAWHADCRRRGLVQATGNAHVKDMVAQGTCALGLTDTDDYFVAMDEAKPVGALPFRLENRKTICIPNTVAIIRGTHRPDDAQKLVDYLLSQECEVALANSKSRQVPLGPVDDRALPEPVRQLKAWASDGADLTALAQARTECLGWLKAEYLR